MRPLTAAVYLGTLYIVCAYVFYDKKNVKLRAGPSSAQRGGREVIYVNITVHCRCTHFVRCLCLVFIRRRCDANGHTRARRTTLFFIFFVVRHYERPIANRRVIITCRGRFQ